MVPYYKAAADGRQNAMIFDVYLLTPLMTMPSIPFQLPLAVGAPKLLSGGSTVA
jgi:hypothetical protein